MRILRLVLIKFYRQLSSKKKKILLSISIKITFGWVLSNLMYADVKMTGLNLKVLNFSSLETMRFIVIVWSILKGHMWLFGEAQRDYKLLSIVLLKKKKIIISCGRHKESGFVGRADTRDKVCFETFSVLRGFAIYYFQWFHHRSILFY